MRALEQTTNRDSTLCVALPFQIVNCTQLSEAAGSCSCLCWRESTPGLPPLLLGGHAAGGSIWGYHSPNMAWQVSQLSQAVLNKLWVSCSPE